MDSRCRFLTLGTPWTQSMPSRDVNAVTRLAEASWRRDNQGNDVKICPKYDVMYTVYKTAYVYYGRQLVEMMWYLKRGCADADKIELWMPDVITKTQRHYTIFQVSVWDLSWASLAHTRWIIASMISLVLIVDVRSDETMTMWWRRRDGASNQWNCPRQTTIALQMNQFAYRDL